MEDTYNVKRSLAEIINNLSEDSEELDNIENRIQIQMTSTDVTGSLGVWGISH